MPTITTVAKIRDFRFSTMQFLMNKLIYFPYLTEMNAVFEAL